MARQSCFFSSAENCNPGYRNIRDIPRNAEHREFVESLWKIYSPYADKNFLSDAVNHFQERFWEMYLGVTFLTKGFSIERGRDKGPEFCFQKDCRKVWVEAITPGPGSGPDAYALPRQQGSTPVAFTVPVNEIILRLRHAIEEKKKKYDAYVADGIVAADDICIVAINSKGIDVIVLDADIHNIVKAVYPIGDLVVDVDRETLKVVDQ